MSYYVSPQVLILDPARKVERIGMSLRKRLAVVGILLLLVFLCWCHWLALRHQVGFFFLCVAEWRRNMSPTSISKRPEETPQSLSSFSISLWDKSDGKFSESPPSLFIREIIKIEHIEGIKIEFI